VTTVEDRTRAAMDAITGLVESVPPLPLPPPPGVASRGLAPSRRRRWAAWLAPAAAAAAVLAVAISLVVVKDMPNGHVVPPHPPARAQDAVPRYYVTLYSSDLRVGDTFTGTKVADVPPPSGAYFAGIAAAADDRTFVVDTEPGGGSDYSLPRTWYLLRIAPGTAHPALLTKLPIPSFGGIDAIALSSSGREFAVATEGKFTAATQGKITSALRIYSVATGKLLHTWSTKVQGVFGEGDYFTEQSRALAWIDGDRAVAFFAATATEPQGLITGLARLRKEKGLSKKEQQQRELALVRRYGVRDFSDTWRRLDLATGGGDLMADSKVILSVPAATYTSGCQYGWIEGISADGKTVVCGEVAITQGTERKPLAWRVAWLAYSIPAGKVRTLYHVTIHGGNAPFIYPFWVSASGGALIGEWGRIAATPAGQAPHVGVIRNGTFRQIPLPPDAGAMAPSVTW
jgi:hypothetical protein